MDRNIAEGCPKVKKNMIVYVERPQRFLNVLHVSRYSFLCKDHIFLRASCNSGGPARGQSPPTAPQAQPGDPPGGGKLRGMGFLVIALVFRTWNLRNLENLDLIGGSTR